MCARTTYCIHCTQQALQRLSTNQLQTANTAAGAVAAVALCAVHPDPLDSYALATYAAATKRTSELLPLEHIDKCREFSGPFAVPGARLFEDFCKDLVHRYCLEGAVVQDKVGPKALHVVLLIVLGGGRERVQGRLLRISARILCIGTAWRGLLCRTRWVSEHASSTACIA